MVAGKTTSESVASDQEEWEPILRDTLERCIQVEQYPRSIIQIVCHVLSNDGSVLAACLHAAVAALLDAGVAMKQLPTAVAIRVVCKNERDGRYHLSLDPDMEQEQDSDLAPQDPSSALLFIAVAQFSSSSSSSDKNELAVLAAHSRGGRAPLSVWPKATSLAERVRPALTNFMKLALEQKMLTRSGQP